MSALAVLREPTAEEASRWHRPRKQPVLTRLRALSDCLEQEGNVRLVKRTAAGTELVVDAPGGTTWRVTFREEQITIQRGPALVPPEGAPVDAAVYLGDACALVEVLQLGSGFYVQSDELIGFDPVGECPACRMEVFEWQDACVGCAADLHPDPPGAVAEDARARRVVDAMLRHEMIELVSPRGRRSVERAVAAFYAMSGARAGVLLSIFMEMPDVAEVYCDESALFQILSRIH
jgi:hypothetical protein